MNQRRVVFITNVQLLVVSLVYQTEPARWALVWDPRLWQPGTVLVFCDTPETCFLPFFTLLISTPP